MKFNILTYRYIGILLFLFIVSGSYAQNLDQRISLNVKNKPLKEGALRDFGEGEYYVLL
ncbi:MAG: hypothetical protein IPH84_13555 [Bacteroidales bacterium]|nr:hypothetical protein [Bacteroidales bacterium]